VSGRGVCCEGVGPAARCQLGDEPLGTGGQAAEHVAEVEEGIHADEPAALDGRVKDRRPAGALEAAVVEASTLPLPAQSSRKEGVHMKTAISRRKFLSESTKTATVATLGAMTSPRAVPASDKVVCGVIGVRGRGHTIIRMLSGLPDASVAAVCDVDRDVGERAAQTATDRTGHKPKLYEDFRKVLDDPSIDAVIVSTPNHWHAPMAILAMQAGKDVYLEKMGSHVFREGRLLINAAKRYKRVVQHGSQMRSSEVTAKARELLDSGVIGEVKMSKAWNLQRQQDLFPVPNEPVPARVNYDMWLGPAPERPFNRNRFHSTWPSFRAYGNGDLGNDGIHDLDMARFGLNPRTHPIRVTAHGSRIDLKGEGEFPDNMTIAYQFDEDKVLVYEDRLWTPYGQYEFDSGNAFYGTEGFMVFSRRGYFQVYLGPKEEKGPGMKGGGGNPEHMIDFFNCVRTREKPVATIEEGHKSLALVHLGEIAFRTRTVVEFDPDTEKILNSREAHSMLSKDLYRDPWDPEKMLA
jgi:predicted dehydrogenase